MTLEQATEYVERLMYRNHEAERRSVPATDCIPTAFELRAIHIVNSVAVRLYQEKTVTAEEAQQIIDRIENAHVPVMATRLDWSQGMSPLESEAYLKMLRGEG